MLASGEIEQVKVGDKAVTINGKRCKLRVGAGLGSWELDWLGRSIREHLRLPPPQYPYR